MKSLLLILISLILSGLLFFLAYQAGVFNKSPARLEIVSSPSARVSLNDADVGTTSYINDKLKSGTYRIKISPIDSSQGLLPYETIITVSKGDSVVINHTFAPSSPDSFGYTLELHKQAGKDALLSVVTDPDNANITLGSTQLGYSPQNRLPVPSGEHQLLLSSPGYKPISASVNLLAGHSLLVTAKLAVNTIELEASPSATPSASPSATPAPQATLPPSPASPSPTPAPQKPYVIIEETGTGWLRVRSLPSASGEELGTALVGTTLPYLGETTDAGWHKVEFEGKPGWLSSRYSRLIR